MEPYTPIKKSIINTERLIITESSDHCLIAQPAPSEITYYIF